MPAIAELRRAAQRLTLAGALTFGPTVACAQDSQPSSPSPSRLPQTSSRELPTVRPQPSPTPEIIIPSLNSELSDKGWVIQKDATSFAKVIGDTIFYKDTSGHTIAMEAKTRKQLWKSPEASHLATADDTRLVTIDGQSVIIIRDAKTFREIKKIPPPIPNLPLDRLSVLYQGVTITLTQDSLIVPHKETILGTKDGFTVYNKQTGEKVWGAEDKEHTTLLDITHSKIIAGSEDSVSVFDEKTGQALAKLPASKSNNQWVWARQKDMLATALNASGPNNIIHSIVSVYDLKDGKELEDILLRPGYHDQTLDRRTTLCIQYCRGIDKLQIVTYAHSWGESPGTINYAILPKVYLSGSQTAQGPFGSFFIEYSLEDGRPREVKDFAVFRSRPISTSAEGVGTLSHYDTVFTVYPYLSRPSQQGQAPNRKITSILPWEELSTLTPTLETTVPMLNLAGKAGDTIIATSWNKNLGLLGDGSLKIYGVDPRKNPAGPVWTFDSGRRDSLEVIPSPKDNSLYVVGESILKLDAATGRQTQLVGYVGSPPKQTMENNGSIYVETVDGKLFSFRLS